MPIKLSCGKCGKTHTIGFESCGRSIVCDSCGNAIKVPRMKQASAPPPPAGPAAIPPDEGPDPIDDGPPMIVDEDEPLVARIESAAPAGSRSSSRKAKSKRSRLSRINAEKTPEGFGCLATIDYMNAAFSILVGIILVALGFMTEEPSIRVYCLAMGVVSGIVGLLIFFLVAGYMALQKWAIITRLIIAIPGLLSFPVGTIVNIFVIVVLMGGLSASGRRSKRGGKPRRRR